MVGGHCIGVDPYYFTYEAEKLGYHSQIILNGRIVNDGMGAFVANATIKQLTLAGKAPRNCKVVVLGITFKENCPDTRNSKVNDVLETLREYGVDPLVIDPVASATDAEREYGVKLVNFDDVHDADCVILAVAHNEFKAMGIEGVGKLFGNGDSCNKVLIDVKSMFDKKAVAEAGYRYWRL